MLTLMRRAGFRFYVKSGSTQEKPHIYVTRDGQSWAKFSLNPVSALVNNGFSRTELTRVQGMVTDLEPQLLQVWWEYARSQGVRPEKEERQAPKPAPSPQGAEASADPAA